MQNFFFTKEDLMGSPNNNHIIIGEQGVGTTYQILKMGDTVEVIQFNGCPERCKFPIDETK